MEFGAFIAPLGSERFMADHFGQRPVHIPAPEGGRSAVVDWTRLKALLAIRSHWSERNIDLVMNSRAVAREHYMDGAASLEGGPARLADPNKVGAFLSMGASLVANSVEQIAPEVRALTDMLARHFAGRAEANLYCSFGGIQAFASHYDPHEVFALHCEGEKVWRIYRNRADAPLTPILGDEGAQQVIDRIKGPVLMEVPDAAGRPALHPARLLSRRLGEQRRFAPSHPRRDSRIPGGSCFGCSRRRRCATARSATICPTAGKGRGRRSAPASPSSAIASPRSCARRLSWRR